VQVIQRAYAGREAPELLLAGRIVAHTRRAICRHCIRTAINTNSHRCSHGAINTAAAHGSPLSEPITNVDWRAGAQTPQTWPRLVPPERKHGQGSGLYSPGAGGHHSHNVLLLHVLRLCSRALHTVPE
jgi:hypothetical protein